MSGQFTQSDKDYLYQIFADNDHEVREGAKTKDGSKIQWFVYLTWEAIQRHLDARYFGEWSDEYHSHRDLNGYSEVYCRITIRGISRENNGSNSGNSNQDEHQGKGASTDAFKRAAAKWGIGLYLREIPKKIYTPYDYVNGKKTDWNLKRQRQNEAMKQVTDWLKTLRSPVAKAESKNVLTTTFIQEPSEGNSRLSENVVAEKVTGEVTLVGVKDGGNSKYLIADGCTFFSREVFRRLSYDDSTINQLGKIGMVTLPDAIRIVYTDLSHASGKSYRNPLRVQRISTGEVITIDELNKKASA